MHESDGSFAPVELAPGITAEERAQGQGQCSSPGADSHLFVMQSRPVRVAHQQWGGASRDGAMQVGHVSFLPAGMPFLWEWDGGVSSLHVTVVPQVVGELIGGSTTDPVDVPPRFLLVDPLARHQLEALRVRATSADGDSLRAELLVTRLVRHLSGRRGAGDPPRAGLPPARLAAVLEYLDAHLAERVSVRQLAAVAGVETSWFTRLFVAAVGRSPYQYLLERRIVRAQYLLRSGTAVGAVASACGFVDQAHLTRHFRRITGATPRAWAAATR